MIKKLFLAVVLISLTFSCGKKGDPIYSSEKKNFKNTKIFVVS